MPLIWMYVIEKLDNFNSFLQYALVIKNDSIYEGFLCLVTQWENGVHLVLAFYLVQGLEQIKEFREGKHLLKETETASPVNRPQISK